MQNTLHFINGEFVPSASGKTFEKRSPLDNTKLGTVAEGGQAEVNAAVAAAKAAQHGDWGRLPGELNLATLGVVMEKNGGPMAMAATGAVMGHPANAVALVVKVLHELGDTLPADSLVLSGGITEAIPAKPGDFVGAWFQSLGSVGFRFA